MASSATIPAAIRQLRSSSRVAQLRAAQMLEELAAQGGEAAAEAIVAAGGIPALLGLLGSGSSQAAQQAALRALYCMGHCHSTACAVILSAGGLPRLVQLLHYSSEAQLTNARLASGVLGMLSLHGGPEYREAILAAGAAELLVRMLASRHVGAQLAAAITIGSITMGHFSAAAAFTDAGAVQRLVLCLESSSDEDLLTAAASALATLTARDGLIRPSLLAAEAGAMPRLVQLLHGGNNLQAQAAFVLGNIATDALTEQRKLAAPLMAAFVAAGAVPATARLLTQQGSAKVQSAAAAIAGLLAWSGAGYAAECVAAGMVPSLHRLLSSSDSNLQNAASCSLHVLALYSAEAAAVVEQAELPPAFTLQLRTSDQPRNMRPRQGWLPAGGCGKMHAFSGRCRSQQPVRRPPDGHHRQRVNLSASRVPLMPFCSADVEDSAVLHGMANDTAAISPAIQPPAAERQPTQRLARICAAEGCSANRGLRRCGGCGTVRYCSEACCKAHWRAHKAECRRLQAAAVAVPHAQD